VKDNLTDEQRLIQDSVTRFLSDHYVFDERRRMPPATRAFDPAIWNGLAELGLMALLAPADAGGFDGNLDDALIVSEALGRHLVREPWIYSAVLSGRAVSEVATGAQHDELLAAMAAGDTRMALAYAEAGGRWDPTDVHSTAHRTTEGYRLNGRKAMIYGAPNADRLLVTARTSGGGRERGGISLFLVDANQVGLTRRDYFTIDAAAASDLTLEDVLVPHSALLGAEGAALPGIERAIDWAIVALCANAVGAMQAAHEKTIEYAKTRIVFGQPLSKQQVIQHRIVDMAVAIEHASAITAAACDAVMHDSPRRAVLVAAAKALLGAESRFVAQWAVQIHGAIGFTDELDIGHYFRKLTLFDTQFGNRDYHLARYYAARLEAGEEGRSMFRLDGLTEDDIAFREEVRSFLAENLTPRMKEARRRTLYAFSDLETAREWNRILDRKGWSVPNWPAQYGGTSWTVNKSLIWSLESARALAPIYANMGSLFCAPCIMAFGTDAQKAEFLPAIRNSDDIWAQGYSEPGAGSDLANLSLRAERQGDHYVLNGSKIWTTFAHHANRIFVLCRTSNEAKKQQGITFLLVDLDTPGITIRPIINLAGEHEVNEVFFEDVKVPVERRLGAEGDGWSVAKHLLDFEHGGNLYVIFELENRLRMLETIARVEPASEGGQFIDDNIFQRRFAEAAVQAEASMAAAKRTIAAVQGGGAPGQVAALRNIRLREVSQRLTELLLDATGPYGGADQGEARDLDSDMPVIGMEHLRMTTALYLAQRAATIAGGTPEIHRNNLARRYFNL
jgi:alkylation response protein AidB-like acyl-CoA dehydrogenase